MTLETSIEQLKKDRRREQQRARRRANPEKAALYMRKWRAANPEKQVASRRKWVEAHRELLAEQSRKWRLANPEKVADQNRKWRLANPERWAAHSLKWYKTHREREVERLRIRRLATPGRGAEVTRKWRLVNRHKTAAYRKANRLVENARRRISRAVSRERTVKSLRSLILIGCTAIELKAWLEAKFRPGMTSENYGAVWHVDHIRPVASFDLSDPEQQKECFHFTNLQPLFALENIRKGAHWNN